MLDSVLCEIDLQGYFCNYWPTIAIYHNDICIHRGSIEDTVTLSFTLNCTNTNELIFEHYGKRSGEDNIWDTDPATEQDRKIQITDIRLNNVSIGTKLRGNLIFDTDFTDSQRTDREFVSQYTTINQSDGWMTFNGKIKFKFETPVYDWLILNKFQITKTGNQSYFSGFSDRWNYEEDLIILNEIKQVMGFDENSNSSSTET